MGVRWAAYVYVCKNIYIYIYIERERKKEREREREITVIIRDAYPKRSSKDYQLG